MPLLLNPPTKSIDLNNNITLLSSRHLIGWFYFYQLIFDILYLFSLEHKQFSDTLWYVFSKFDTIWQKHMLTSTGTMLCPTPQQAGFRPTFYCEESGIKKQTWTTYKTSNKKECTTEVFFCDLFLLFNYF